MMVNHKSTASPSLLLKRSSSSFLRFARLSVAVVVVLVPFRSSPSSLDCSKTASISRKTTAAAAFAFQATRPHRLTTKPTTKATAFLVGVTAAESSCPTTNPKTSTTALSSSNTETPTTTATMTPMWFQHQISVTAPSRGCHLITGDVQKAIGADVKNIKIGMCNLFIQHTSASLTINENADPDVRRDMEVALNKIVPAQWNRDGSFKHTLEGDDDMPGHVKSSLMGVSLNVPIQNGRLALGTWQGIYLNEHRDQGGWGGGHTRRILITLQGQG